MKLRSAYRRFLFCLTGVALSGSLLAAEDTLTPLEVVNLTLKNSPQIRNQKFGVEKAKGQARSATGAFDIVTNVTAGRVRSTQTLVDISGLRPNEQATYNNLPPAQRNNLVPMRETSTTTLLASANKQFRTGVTTTLSLANTQADNDPAISANPLVNVTNRGVVMFTVNVPLLKGSGTEGSLAAVERSAELNYQATLSTYQHTISQIIRDSIIAYWNYVNADWYLARINDSKARIEALIARIRTPSNSLQSYLEDRKGQIIDAQNRLDQVRVALAQVMGIPASDLQTLGKPTPDFPISWGEQLSRFDRQSLESAWLKEAEEKRLDYRATKLQLEATQTLLTKARKDLLPTVNLSLGMGYNGFAQYDGFNQFIEADSENRNKADYNVNLVFNYPIGNNVAQGNLDTTNATYQQALIANQDSLRGIKLNVRGDLSNLYGQMQKSVQIEKTVLSYKESIKDLQNNPGILTDSSRQVTAMELEDKFLAAQKERSDALSGLANAIASARFTTGTLIRTEDANAMVNMVDLQTPPSW